MNIELAREIFPGVEFEFVGETPIIKTAYVHNSQDELMEQYSYEDGIIPDHYKACIPLLNNRTFAASTLKEVCRMLWLDTRSDLGISSRVALQFQSKNVK